MSHWTRVKLKVNDESTLVAALKKMGANNVQTGTHSIKAYGQSDQASVWIDNGVGFKKTKDGTYEMIGDFYHSSDFYKYYSNNGKFETDLTTAYAVEDVKARVDELGFEISENSEGLVGEDGMIRMVAVSFY